jgi:hypothetical protein
MRTIMAIRAQNDMSCTLYVHPKKTEFLYFPVYVFRTSLLCIFVLPYEVLKTFT